MHSTESGKDQYRVAVFGQRSAQKEFLESLAKFTKQKNVPSKIRRFNGQMGTVGIAYEQVRAQNKNIVFMFLEPSDFYAKSVVKTTAAATSDLGLVVGEIPESQQQLFNKLSKAKVEIGQPVNIRRALQQIVEGIEVSEKTTYRKAKVYSSREEAYAEKGIKPSPIPGPQSWQKTNERDEILDAPNEATSNKPKISKS